MNGLLGVDVKEPFVASIVYAVSVLFAGLATYAICWVIGGGVGGGADEPPPPQEIRGETSAQIAAL
jgi:hypothetical protein